MRLLVDECAGPAVARWLRGLAQEVYSVYDQSRGMSDEEILAKAHCGKLDPHHERQGLRR
jgi:hypothetical protein